MTMKTFKPSFFPDTFEVEKLKEKIFYAMQDDNKLAETTVLFAKLNDNSFVDDFIKDFLKDDIFAENTMFFLLSKIKEIPTEKLRVSNKDNEVKMVVKNFLNTLSTKTRFEVLTNTVFRKGSLNAVKFLMTHFEFNTDEVLSSVYHNSMEVFFYVLNTFKKDINFITALVEKKLASNDSFFNFEIVKELVLSDDIVLTEELKNYQIMSKIVVFKNLSMKSKCCKKETVKI